jgi:ADP-heptose:LPS heptosyltransferase
MVNFLHSGKLGDIIWALPAIKHLGGGTLYLRINEIDHGPNEIKLTEEGAQSISALLKTQPYIHDVKIHTDEKIDYDLNLFRRFIFAVPEITIAESVFMGLGIRGNHEEKLDEPWILVDKDTNVLNKIVISRTNRYRNSEINPFYLKLKDRNISKHGIFVGSIEEYEKFEEVYRTGIEYYPTPTILDLARVIAASKFYVGNENLANALNESMKKTSFLENNKNPIGQFFCYFNRPDLFLI